MTNYTRPTTNFFLLPKLNLFLSLPKRKVARLILFLGLTLFLTLTPLVVWWVRFSSINKVTIIASDGVFMIGPEVHVVSGRGRYPMVYWSSSASENS